MDITINDLRNAAVEAAQAVVHAAISDRRLHIVRHLRDTFGHQPLRSYGLRGLIEVADWAMEHCADDLSRYLVDNDATEGYGWLYRFPNGHSVSVIPDPTRLYRFEMLIDANRDPLPGLATAEVEAKLMAVYTMPPAAPAHEIATVTVDAAGRLTADSTVTVQGETWPIPERTDRAGILAPARIGVALAERGWRTVRDAEHDRSTPGVVRIPIQPVDDEK